DRVESSVGEHAQLVLPGAPELGEAVQEQDQRPRPGLGDVEPAAVGEDEPVRPVTLVQDARIVDWHACQRTGDHWIPPVRLIAHRRSKPTTLRASSGSDSGIVQARYSPRFVTSATGAQPWYTPKSNSSRPSVRATGALPPVYSSRSQPSASPSTMNGSPCHVQVVRT